MHGLPVAGRMRREALRSAALSDCVSIATAGLWPGRASLASRDFVALSILPLQNSLQFNRAMWFGIVHYHIAFYSSCV